MSARKAKNYRNESITKLKGADGIEDCFIGAESVITRDILAVGNPCRVIREITEKDSLKYKRELF